MFKCNPDSQSNRSRKPNPEYTLLYNSDYHTIIEFDVCETESLKSHPPKTNEIKEDGSDLSIANTFETRLNETGIMCDRKFQTK